MTLWKKILVSIWVSFFLAALFGDDESFFPIFFYWIIGFMIYLTFFSEDSTSKDRWVNNQNEYNDQPNNTYNSSQDVKSYYQRVTSDNTNYQRNYHWKQYHFLCLANSKKYSWRCVAGICFKIDNQTCKPFWIRPISNDKHWQISEYYAGEFEVWEILQFYGEPSNARLVHQSENYIMNSELNKSNEYVNTSDILKQMLSQTSYIFGNQWNAIDVNSGNNLNHSLVLIRPTNISFYEKIKDNWKRQSRCKFYLWVQYDLPVTIIPDNTSYLKQYNNTHCYLVISLWTEFNSSYWKLVAWIMPIPWNWTHSNTNYDYEDELPF